MITTATIARPRPSLIEYRDSPKPGRRKYANEPTTVDGIRFDSKAEAKRWCELKLLERVGEISNLQRQVPFELIPAQVTPDGRKIRAMKYIADFTFLDKAGSLVVEDPKGCGTAEWKIKQKMMLWRHGIWVREIKS
jgi:hypothetical protein